MLVVARWARCIIVTFSHSGCGCLRSRRNRGLDLAHSLFYLAPRPTSPRSTASTFGSAATHTAKPDILSHGPQRTLSVLPANGNNCPAEKACRRGCKKRKYHRNGRRSRHPSYQAANQAHHWERHFSTSFDTHTSISDQRRCLLPRRFYKLTSTSYPITTFHPTTFHRRRQLPA